VPPYTIVSGNPASFLRDRFKDDWNSIHLRFSCILYEDRLYMKNWGLYCGEILNIFLFMKYINFSYRFTLAGSSPSHHAVVDAGVSV
jgi:hypothetical protein